MRRFTGPRLAITIGVCVAWALPFAGAARADEQAKPSVPEADRVTTLDVDRCAQDSEVEPEAKAPEAKAPEAKDPATKTPETEDPATKTPEAEDPDAQEPETAEEREARIIGQAGDAYDRGLVLYEEGDYAGAVKAFVNSYCKKAHPAAFYNIAQSYERLLDFERSVLYFERYVSESAPDSANTKKAKLRAEVLRNLPAQIRIATVQKKASVTIRNAAGIIARGVANDDVPLEVRQGKYELHVEKPGFETIVRQIETKPGQPYFYYLSLTPDQAELQVTVSPSNARIFVDKRLVGVGSYAESLPIGSYEIMVEAPGRDSELRTIELTEGKRSNQVIELDKPRASGRLELLIASGLGLGLTGGLALGGLLGQDPAIFLGAGLATTAVGFGGAYFGIPESVTRGDAWYLIEATLIGGAEGYFLGSLASCKSEFIEGPDPLFEEEAEDCALDIQVGATITGAMVGAVAATATRSRFQLRTGDAALIASTTFWGVASGIIFYSIFDNERRLREPILLVGLNAGVVAGSGLVTNSELSLRRVAIIDLGGLGGMVGGIGVSLTLGSDGNKLQHYALLGMITGLVATTFFTSSMDDEKSGDTSLVLSPGLGATRDAEGKTVMSVGVSAAF